MNINVCVLVTALFLLGTITIAKLFPHLQAFLIPHHQAANDFSAC